MPLFTLWGVKPDLTLLVVVSWGLARGVRDGAVWGIIGGIMLDFMSGAPFGGHAIAVSLASALVGLATRNLFRFGFVLPLMAAVVSTVIYDLALAAFFAINGRPIQWLDLFTRIVLPSIPLTLLGMPLVFWAGRALHRATRPARIEWE